MIFIRQKLVRLIELNYAERWVAPNIALQQLEHYGDDLIPGLIECLADLDDEVQCLAIELLAEARPRSDIAVPALIELLTDDARDVQMAVISNIAGFGPIAVGAIPYLEPWLGYDDEYLRILAATTIMRLDPIRTDLLPDIRAALKSGNPNVRFTAREFFRDKKTSQDKEQQP